MWNPDFLTRGNSKLAQISKPSMLLWAESLRKQKSTFFFAWNSSDCFESFSPSILSTTEGVKTTRSNRMKFRLRSSPLPLSSRLFYFFCEKRVLVLPKDAHRPFIFSLPHYSPLRFWSINPPLFYFLTRLVISQEKISGSGKGYMGAFSLQRTLRRQLLFSPKVQIHC